MLFVPLNPPTSFNTSLIAAVGPGDHLQPLGPEVVPTCTTWEVRVREIYDYTTSEGERCITNITGGTFVLTFPWEHYC